MSVSFHMTLRNRDLKVRGRGRGILDKSGSTADGNPRYNIVYSILERVIKLTISV